MDVFKRFFNMNSDDNDSKEKRNSKKNQDEFDIFDSQGNNLRFFGFPKDVLDQFEQIMSSLDDFDEHNEVPDFFKEDFFKNSDAFKHYNDFKNSRQSDNDLDGQIYADQLDALLKRVSPDFRGVLPDEKSQTKKKLRLTDDQKIMDMLHGTFKEEVFIPRPREKKVPQRKTPSFNFDGTPLPPTGSVGSRTWGRTIISIRKPDGTFETRKTERNSDGSVITTITKSEKNGKQITETFNTDSKSKFMKPKVETTEYDEEKNLRAVSGYKVPDLW